MKIIRKIKFVFFILLRIKKYQVLSSCKRVTGKPVLHHPLLTIGEGQIVFGSNVEIGVYAAPNFYSHYTFMQVGTINSIITIGNNVSISNGLSIECLSNVVIEDDVLIGNNCSIMDNDGHDLSIENRKKGFVKSNNIHIGKNVFLGANVTILKGVTIGKNTIIGNGAVVTKNIPENVVACGNPAKVIRKL